MDFQNTNLFNVRLNLLSGNLLPMTDKSDKSSFSLFWKVLSIFLWLLILFYIISLIFAYFSVSNEIELSDGLDGLYVMEEIGFIICYSRILVQKTLLQQMIQKLNEALSIEDENMRCIVTTNLKPLKNPFRYCLVIGVGSTIFWCCSTLPLILERNTFYHADFVTPAAFSKEPFSVDVFVLGNVIILVCNIHFFLKIIGVDVYTTHLISLITAQYQYISSRLVLAFRNKKHPNNSNSRQGNSKVDSLTAKEIKNLCRQHVNVMHVTLMLKKLISVNTFYIYIISVFRFCFMGLVMINVSETFSDACFMFFYASGSVTQFYVLYACFQRLSEASSEITNEAFHEDWNQFNLPIKRMFLLMTMASNNIEIKLSLLDRFNLSLPSFMSVLNQAYSIALLILKIS
ncbi:uncharacterized protein LOC105202733 isoform X3 [Solenopsis invicta]|uniref:uncharacterized protein LOC105202733 isoform X3 n=1 Tax=Solenopsis invicta TaxID=13686 RepID=UPI00193CDE19|nr:uncharacterized protein LOC105202733 isoform X3 [Solenopsis invicta]